MRGKDDRLAGRRNLVELAYKNGAARFQSLDHIAVVNDFVADIDGRAMLLQRQDHDLDRAVDAGAKTARAAQAQGQGLALFWRRQIGHF